MAELYTVVDIQPGIQYQVRIHIHSGGYIEVVQATQHNMHSGGYTAADTQRRIHSGGYTAADTQQRIYSGR